MRKISSFVLLLMLSLFAQGCFIFPWGSPYYPNNNSAKTKTNCFFPEACKSTSTNPSDPNTVEPNTTPTTTPNTTTPKEEPKEEPTTPKTDPEERPLAKEVSLRLLRVEDATGNGSEEEMHYIQKELNGLVESFHQCELSSERYPVGESLIRFQFAIGVTADGRFADASEVVMLTDVGQGLAVCVRNQLSASKVSLPPRSYVSLRLQIRAIAYGE